MSNNLIVSDNFKDSITKKVRDVFMDIIPDDKLSEMVSNEIKAFFEDTNSSFIVTEVSSSGWSNNKTLEYKSSCTPFRLLIWKEVTSLVKSKVQALTESEALKAEVYTAISNDGYNEAVATLSEKWEAKLDTMVLDMAKEMFRGAFAQAVTAARTNTVMDIEAILNNRGF
jgi:hypothetical protein